MIIVAGSVEFNTADYQALKADILSLEAATRQENGCLYYSFALAAQDADTTQITLLEKWQSQAALDTLLKQASLKAFAEKGLQKARNVQIKMYDVTGEREVVIG